MLRIFGPKWEEFVGGWRRLHNEELRNMYALRNIIRVIKLRRMGWVAHVALIGEMRNSCDILIGNPKGRDYWEDLGIDENIILEWILGK
jgi:hypothetical protein